MCASVLMWWSIGQMERHRMARGRMHMHAIRCVCNRRLYAALEVVLRYIYGISTTNRINGIYNSLFAFYLRILPLRNCASRVALALEAFKFTRKTHHTHRSPFNATKMSEWVAVWPPDNAIALLHTLPLSLPLSAIIQK